MPEPMKPSAVQPYMLGGPGRATHGPVNPTNRIARSYAEGQRDARTELRKAMLSFVASADVDVQLDQVLHIITAWMFNGTYALEVDEDDRPDSVAVPPRQPEPGEVRQQD